MHHQTTVEFFGSFILARIKGKPTEAVLTYCQQQVLALVEQTGCRKALYETLEMEAPDVEIPWFQRQLDETAGTEALQRAILVPDSKLAYLARIAFGESHYRVFYNDLSSALKWLRGSELAH